MSREYTYGDYIVLPIDYEPGDVEMYEEILYLTAKAKLRVDPLRYNDDIVSHKFTLKASSVDDPFSKYPTIGVKLTVKESE